MSLIARLVVTSGNQGVFFLRPGVFQIGRSLDCDLFIDDPSVSRQHATFSVTGESTELSDLNSRNGTFVDCLRIEKTQLDHGASIRFGSILCIYQNLRSSQEEESTLSGATAKNSSTELEVELSNSERRIFELLLCGLAEKQIASKLSLSRHTVHNHVKSIYRSYSVHSRSELLVKALNTSN